MMDVFSMEDTPHSLEFKSKLAHQISKCSTCVIAYQDSKKNLEQRCLKIYEESSVAEFFKKLSEWDSTRLITNLKNSDFDENVLTSIFEALRAPNLILDFPELYYTLEKTLENCILNNSYPKMKSRVLFGLAPLSISSNSLISKWAKKVLKNSEGKYNLEDYNSGIKNVIGSVISFVTDPSVAKNPAIENDIIFNLLSANSKLSIDNIWQSLVSLLNKIDNQVISRIEIDFPNLAAGVFRGILNHQSNLTGVLLLFRWIFVNFEPIKLWEDIGKSLKIVPTDMILTILNSEFSRTLLNHRDDNDVIFQYRYPQIDEPACKKSLKRLKGLLGWIEPFSKSVISYSAFKDTELKSLRSLVSSFFNSLMAYWKDGSTIPIINKSATFLISIYFVQFIINSINPEMKPKISDVVSKLLIHISEIVTGDSELSECDYLVSCAESLVSSVLLSDLDTIYDFCSLVGSENSKSNIKNMLSPELWLKISQTPSNIELVKVTLFITSNLFMIDYSPSTMRNYESKFFPNDKLLIESKNWFTEFRLNLSSQMTGYIECINSSLKDNNKEESIAFEKSILQPLFRFLVGSDYKLISATSKIATQSYISFVDSDFSNVSFHGNLGLIYKSAKVLSQNHSVAGIKELIVLLNEWNHLYNNRIPLSKSSINISWLICGYINGLPDYQTLNSIFEEQSMFETNPKISLGSDLDSELNNQLEFDSMDLTEIITNIYIWLEVMIKSIVIGDWDEKVESVSIINENTVVSQIYATESIFSTLEALFKYCKPSDQISFEIINLLLNLMSKWPNSIPVLGHENLILNILLGLVSNIQNSEITLESELLDLFSNSPISNSTLSKSLVKSISIQCFNLTDKKGEYLKDSSSIKKVPKSENLSSEINSDFIEDFDIGDEMDQFELESLLNSLEKTIPGISNPPISNSGSELGSDSIHQELNFSSNLPSSDVEKNDIDIYLSSRSSGKKNKSLLSDWFTKETDKNKIYQSVKSFKPPKHSRVSNSLISRLNDSSNAAKKSFSHKSKFDPTSENSSLINQIRRENYAYSKDSSSKKFINSYSRPVVHRIDRPITQVPRSLSLHSNKASNNYRKTPIFSEDNDNVITFSRDDFKIKKSSVGVVVSSSSSSDSDSSECDERKSKSKGLKALINSDKISDGPISLRHKEHTKRSITFQRGDKHLRMNKSGLIKPISRFTEAQLKIRQEELAKKRLMPSLGNLHMVILAWSFEDSGKLPPNLPGPLKKVPKTFNSVEEYHRIFEPLLLSECWAQFQRSIEETADLSTVLATVMSRASVDKFGDITLMLNSSDASQWAENDMIMFASELKSQQNTLHKGIATNDRYSNSTSDKNRERFKNRITFIAKVQSISFRKTLANVVVRTNFDKIYCPGSPTLMNSVFVNSKWDALKLMSLVPIHREYAALASIKYLPSHLLDNILNPRIPPSPKNDINDVNKIIKTYNVNKPQAEAILSSIDRVGFTLIQGPPGTGKTKTILALLSMLLNHNLKQDDPNLLNSSEKFIPDVPSDYTKGKILVCAPSNAAVDEIVQRLKEGVYDKNGKIFVPEIVRIGQGENINSSVRDLSLDQLVEDQLLKANSLIDSNVSSSVNSTDPAILAITAQKVFNSSMNSQKLLRKQLDSINDEREKARLIEVSAIKNDESKVLLEIQKKISVLTRAKNTLSRQLNEKRNQSFQYSKNLDSVRRSVKNQIISKAQIICSTLSGSGHEILASMAKFFETVIIDEAAQSIELSSIIPLKYSPKRVILVGDPNQLPPTVLSLDAAKFGYEQSLFVRLQQNCPNIVNLLSIQYRMHPEISSFPSKLFYENLLKDGDDMIDKKSAIWHDSKYFTPFHFFGVYSKETVGRGYSLFNLGEIDFICSLVFKLVSNNPTVNFFHRIGIITPYKQQLRELKKSFARNFGRKVLDSIDFNTVDGFQGQEKDIIIFSTVRSNENGIGFLNDLRRMNVAITRARNSLFIVADPRAMSSNEKWEMLLENSKLRGIYTDDVRRVPELSIKGPYPKIDLENLLNEDYDWKNSTNPKIDHSLSRIEIKEISNSNSNSLKPSILGTNIPEVKPQKDPSHKNIEIIDVEEINEMNKKDFINPPLLDGTLIIEDILSGNVKIRPKLGANKDIKSPNNASSLSLIVSELTPIAEYENLEANNDKFLAQNLEENSGLSVETTLDSTTINNNSVSNQRKHLIFSESSRNSPIMEVITQMGSIQAYSPEESKDLLPVYSESTTINSREYYNLEIVSNPVKGKNSYINSERNVDLEYKSDLNNSDIKLNKNPFDRPSSSNDKDVRSDRKYIKSYEGTEYEPGEVRNSSPPLNSNYEVSDEKNINQFHEYEDGEIFKAAGLPIRPSKEIIENHRNSRELDINYKSYQNMDNRDSTYKDGYRRQPLNYKMANETYSMGLEKSYDDFNPEKNTIGRDNFVGRNINVKYNNEEYDKYKYEDYRNRNRDQDRDRVININDEGLTGLKGIPETYPSREFISISNKTYYEKNKSHEDNFSYYRESRKSSNEYLREPKLYKRSISPNSKSSNSRNYRNRSRSKSRRISRSRSRSRRISRSRSRSKRISRSRSVSRNSSNEDLKSDRYRYSKYDSRYYSREYRSIYDSSKNFDRRNYSRSKSPSYYRSRDKKLNRSRSRSLSRNRKSIEQYNNDKRNIEEQSYHIKKSVSSSLFKYEDLSNSYKVIDSMNGIDINSKNSARDNHFDEKKDTDRSNTNFNFIAIKNGEYIDSSFNKNDMCKDSSKSIQKNNSGRVENIFNDNSIPDKNQSRSNENKASGSFIVSEDKYLNNRLSNENKSDNISSYKIENNSTKYDKDISTIPIPKTNSSKKDIVQVFKGPNAIRNKSSEPMIPKTSSTLKRKIQAISSKTENKHPVNPTSNVNSKRNAKLIGSSKGSNVNNLSEISDSSIPKHIIFNSTTLDKSGPYNGISSKPINEPKPFRKVYNSSENRVGEVPKSKNIINTRSKV
ncbi:Helicase sen1 [Smittium mucronatum]|uniref:Helicase sen1 n=1 Tax=Smittium mucronatum TaxID=133383 RepID=A0A1R0GY31_9FUNG|nr:Helicase sen1 [Smittium mucronatum]